jgi:hypothetical protein
MDKIPSTASSKTQSIDYHHQKYPIKNLIVQIASPKNSN